MASRKTAVVEDAPESVTEETVVNSESEEKPNARTRRSFNYDPSALGITPDAVTNEDEDFTPNRGRGSQKANQVLWLEPILAESYEKDVWKGATIPAENVDAFKQAVIYASAVFFDNMGMSFNFDNREDGKVRVSFKMKDKIRKPRKAKKVDDAE